MTWDETTIGRLRQLWADGLSTAAIARELGCTNNAVIGKARRIGVDARPSPIVRRMDADKLAEINDMLAKHISINQIEKTTGIGKDTIRAISKGEYILPDERVTLQAPASVKIAPPPARDETKMPVIKDGALRDLFMPPPALVVPRLEPEVRQRLRAADACQWPTGDDKRSYFQCSDAAVLGRPYCDAHCCVAYTNWTARRAKLISEAV